MITNPTLQKLTPREKEITNLLVWGLSKKEVAIKLKLSIRTVENIARNIYEKLKVNSIGQLSSWWISSKYGEYEKPDLFVPLPIRSYRQRDCKPSKSFVCRQKLF